MWTEYDEISRESIKKVAEEKAYTATTVFDLLHSVAPKMMKRAEAHFSHGIAENLDDKYTHHKYWSNPLETKYVLRILQKNLILTSFSFVTTHVVSPY